MASLQNRLTTSRKTLFTLTTGWYTYENNEKAVAFFNLSVGTRSVDAPKADNKHTPRQKAVEGPIKYRNGYTQ